MADEKDIYYKYQENRATTGDRSALLVKLPNEDKYSMFLAVASLPSFEGSTDTVEFELINMPAAGQLEGKKSLENIEINFMYHRDNIFRLEKYKGKVLDFLDFQPDYTGKHFRGTYNYRRDTAESGSALQGILTIVPMSEDDKPILNCRDMVQETLCFSQVIPATVSVGDTLDLSIVQSDATPTYTYAKLDNEGNETADTSSFTGTGSKITVASGASGLYAIKVSADGYASWTTTVYVQSGVSGASLYSAPTPTKSSY